jgi:hypothetical protein
MHVTESVHFIHTPHGAFDGALAGNVQASKYADIPIVRGHTTRPDGGGPHHVFINSVRLLSAENLKWRVEIWGKSLPVATRPNSPETWAPLLTTSYLASDATAYGTLYAYYTHGLKVPYEDMEGKGELHVNLVNADGTAKSAGSAGFAHLLVGTISAA